MACICNAIQNELGAWKQMGGSPRFDLVQTWICYCLDSTGIFSKVALATKHISIISKPSILTSWICNSLTSPCTFWQPPGVSPQRRFSEREWSLNILLKPFQAQNLPISGRKLLQSHVPFSKRPGLHLFHLSPCMNLFIFYMLGKHTPWWYHILHF